MAIIPDFPEAPLLPELQAFMVRLKADNGWTPTDFRHELALLVEEVGELAKAHRKSLPTARLTPEQRAKPDSVADELADVLSYTMNLANMAGVDLWTAFQNKMDKNRSRTWEAAGIRNKP